MRKTMAFFPCIVGLLLSSQATAKDDTHFDFAAEAGFLSVVNHRIQFSESNTDFDYVSDGGQDVLFAYQRYTGEIYRPGDYRLKLVYQPIDIKTSHLLEEDLMVDNVTFAAGTAMDYRYSFPYYRATYLWNLVTTESFDLYAGLGMQIRNATIVFASQSGEQYVSNRDVGPVPLFALAGSYQLSDASWLDFEAEGNYANTSVINGDDDNAVRGAIFDSALAWRRAVSDKLSVVTRVRYVTGGAEGNSEEPDNPTGDGYSSNWIDLLACSAGLVFHLENW